MSRIALFLKAAAIGFISLLLLIPLGMIQGTVSERQRYRSVAVESVTESYAGAQRLVGPVLVVHYEDESEVVFKDDKGVETRQKVITPGHWLFYPETLDVQGKLVPGKRKLGLHEVRVYELQGRMGARFRSLLPPPADREVIRRVSRSYLSISVSDVRGLAGTPKLAINGKPVALRQGVGEFRAGAGVNALLSDVSLGQLDIRVNFDFALGGTENLSIAPIARSNKISLQSSWQHPNFSGRFLPRMLQQDQAGFHAQWEISSLAADTQGQYRAGRGLETLDALSVTLIDPVNIYTQADRASKYGFLFVMLTFVGFLMFELIKKLPIHPIQYGLVGMALAIFFLLLLSLSEHIAFWQAYLVASIACIGLLGVYLSSVLKSRARGLGFSTMLTMLYATLYGLLVSEDNALVLGSLMLFAILAVIMIVTRKIDWYALSTPTPPPVPAVVAEEA